MPNKSVKLNVVGNHKLHVETAGNPDGQVFLFLHGGPGAGLNGHYKWPFDLERHFVIAFDQRGCGHSKPFLETDFNDTSLLISDIEAIRQHFNIKQWNVFGGSWGSTLALLYAIEYPERIQSLILRGVFLARQQDLDFFLTPEGAAACTFPEEYANFIKDIKAPLTSSNVVKQYYELMNSSDLSCRENAYKQWFTWELAISRLKKDTHIQFDQIPPNIVKSLAGLECHYIKHNCFVSENFILENASVLEKIRTYIVHGRYDMVCKAAAAYDLHSVLRNSNLYMIEDAGHSAQEPGIRKKLIEIVNNI